jgi:VWFA-related protein
VRSRLCLLVVVCGVAVTLAAQDEQSSEMPRQPTFVAGTQYVRVDLYATRDGQLVDDLRPDEVELFEDGVPQTLDAFERIAFRAPDLSEPPLVPRTLAASRQLAADARSRVFVVFIDPWHTVYVSAENPEQAAAAQRRFPVLRQLEEALGPDDLVAVMTPDMRPEDLSFARGLMGLAQLEGDWSGPSSIIRPDPGRAFGWDEMELLYRTCYPELGGPAGAMISRRRERMTLDAIEALADHLGDLREERKAVLLVTDGWPLYTPTVLASSDSGAAPAPPRPPIGGRGLPGEPTAVTERGLVTVSAAAQARCEADRATLGALDHRGRLEAIIGRANRSNVSIYPASPAGLDTRLTGGGAVVARSDREHRTPFERQSALRLLAEQTDGYAIVNTNNIAGGIARVMADSSAYYLLGYASTNPALDGTYRRITVRVNRPGVQVRARPGYVALPVTRPADVGRIAEPRVLDPVEAALNRVANTNVRAPLLLRGAA